MTPTTARSKGWLTIIANLVVVAAAIIVLVRPSGGFRAAYEARQARAATLDSAHRLWDSLVAEGGRLGSGEPRRIVIEFSDYQCPFCRRAHELLTGALADDQELAVVYRHFPIEALHPHADRAARASICSEAQGSFVAMHSVLFETDEWQSIPAWDAVARKAGVRDIAAFLECLDAVPTTDRLARDKALAAALGVRGTPTWITRSDVLVGADSVRLATLLREDG